jgi:hypothetical protein
MTESTQLVIDQPIGRALRVEMMRQRLAMRVRRVPPMRPVPLWVRRVVAQRMRREHAACGRLGPLTMGMVRALSWWVRS